VRAKTIAAAAVTFGALTLLSSAAFAQRRGQRPDPKNPPDKDKDSSAQVDTDAAAPAPMPTTRRQDQQEMVLAVGENKTIPAGDVKNYSEGTPGVIDVKLTSDSSQFVVVGQKAGSTSLLLIRKNGTETNWVINVFSRSPALVEKEVSELLDGYIGVRLRRVGARFFIEGGVSTEADLSRIRQIATLYPGQVESLVALGSGGMNRQTNIRIDFFFVQYKRDSSYGVGISYPTQVGGAAIQSNFGYDFVAKTATAQANVVNQPLPGLDIASHNGWAKVIKQATVITTNGVEANFDNGGEQNFPVASGLTGTIQKITFGTNVTVLPRFDPNTGDLEVKVDADVSDLVPPIASTPLPGRQTAKLATLVHLKLGQSLVLSGIHTRNETHDIDGLPLLSDIPVLGILFGSHKNDRSELEGAVFIVPSVVESPGRPPFDMIKEAMAQYDEFRGEMKGLDAYSKKPSLGGKAGEPPPVREH
jgi:pilus assembly protein CpaC